MSTLTISTDASIFNQKDSHVWSCVIKKGNIVYFYGAKFKDTLEKDINVLEYRAVFNAIFYVVKMGGLDEVSHLVVNTDSSCAREILLGNYKKYRKRNNKYQEYLTLKEILALAIEKYGALKQDLGVSVNTVYGHAGFGATEEDVLNQFYADRLCKHLHKYDIFKCVKVLRNSIKTHRLHNPL